MGERRKPEAPVKNHGALVAAEHRLNELRISGKIAWLFPSVSCLSCRRQRFGYTHGTSHSICMQVIEKESVT